MNKIAIDAPKNNDKETDIIIEYWNQPKKGDDGKTLWVNPGTGDSIAHVHGEIYEITIYQHKDGKNPVMVTFSGYTLKKIIAVMEKIEAEETTEFIDA